MKRFLQYLFLMVFICSCAFAIAGSTTTNGMFYLPAQGASGSAERTAWLNSLEATDGVIKLNSNVRTGADCSPGDYVYGITDAGVLSCSTPEGTGEGGGSGGSGINWDEIVEVSTVGTNWEVAFRDIDNDLDKSINWTNLQTQVLADGAINWDIDYLNMPNNSVSYRYHFIPVEPEVDKSIVIDNIQSGQLLTLCAGSDITNGYGLQISNSSGNICATSHGGIIPAEDADITFNGTAPIATSVACFDDTTGGVIRRCASGTTIDASGNMTTNSVATTGATDWVVKTTSHTSTGLALSSYSSDYLRFGGATNYMQIASGGVVTFAGSASITVPGETYDATGWNGDNGAATKNDVRDKIETITAGSGVSLGGCQDLRSSSSAVTTATITATKCILTDSSSIPKVYSTISETCTITTAGIGGLEASDTEGSSKWYEVMLYGKSDGTIDCLLNEAGTAVGTTPTDYTYSFRTGYVRNDGSSNFVAYQQASKKVSMNTSSVVTTGSATTATDIDLSSAMPPNSHLAQLDINTTDNKVLEFYVNGASNKYTQTWVDATGSTYNIVLEVMTDDSRIVDYLYTTAGGSLTGSVRGYTLD